MSGSDRETITFVQSVSLEQTALAFSQANIERGPALVITTAVPQWSYAAALPLSLDLTGDSDLAVEVRLRVLEGKVRVGVLSADEQSFVVEKEVAANNGPRTYLVLRLPSPPVVGPLIVRNASDVGPSKAILEDVAICRVEPLSRGATGSKRQAASEPSRGEVPALVKSLEYLRPLVPCPGWRFDSDWNNSDFSFQTRRRLWEYCLSNGWDISVELPWYDGQRIELPLLSDAGRQLFVGGCIDPNELAFLDSILKPNTVFVDVGAHVGLYTLFAARRVATVLAFEPSSREFGWFQRNLDRNNLRNVEAIRLALGNTEKQATLRIAESMHSGQNTLHSFSHEGVGSEREEIVEVTCLDRFAEARKVNRIDVIKADVEQSELEVFEGAREVLRLMQPYLLLEAQNPVGKTSHASQIALLELLGGFGYIFYEFNRATGLLAEATADHQVGNLVGCPVHRPLPDDVLTPRRYYFGRGGGKT